MIENTHKVLTFNVWHFDIDREKRAEFIRDELSRIQPDIAMFQEIPFENENHDSLFLDTISERYEVSTRDIFAKVNNRTGEYWDGQAILTNPAVFNCIESGIIRAPEDSKTIYRAQYAVLQGIDNRVVIAINVHGVWGGEASFQREGQFQKINEHARELEQKYSEQSPIVIMGGDLNTESESSPIRYLKGLQSINGDGAFWIDSWEAGKGQGFTSTPKLKYFYDTALSVGITNPSLSPERRIDYLFIKGWVYGRRGYPVKSELVFTSDNAKNFAPSDHYGVLTHVWCN